MMSRKLVATRILEGTQQLRDSPLWDTGDEESNGSESDMSEDKDDDMV